MSRLSITTMAETAKDGAAARFKAMPANGIAGPFEAIQGTPGTPPNQPGRRALPGRVTAHPGEVLREEFLKPLGLSVNGLATALRVPATRVGAIIKGERSVTPDTALRLARFFGNSPEFWINLQAMHDLTRTRMECGAIIERAVHPRAA